jgi:hypothetical protein
MILAQREQLLRKSEKPNMPELTLESLTRPLEDVERRLNEKQATGAKDWRIAAVMFAGRMAQGHGSR